jgi:hypothetical protein
MVSKCLKIKNLSYILTYKMIDYGIKLYYINYNDDVETKLNEILKENAIYKVT